jgi:hypothetical protein
MNGITIVTTPRSGAGHLFALLHNFEDAAPRDDLFVAGYDDLSSKLDQAETEARAAARTVLVVKATSAVPREVMERELLSRVAMRAVFVVRRQIDAYVSLAKAMAMDAWRDTDLTGVKVKLDPARFARWMEAEEAWYAHWKAWLERRAYPIPIVRYETDLTLPGDGPLRRFAAAADQVGLTLRVPAKLTHEGLKKQDRERAAAFRVRNWSEFSKAIGEMGLEKRAFGYPI